MLGFPYQRPQRGPPVGDETRASDVEGSGPPDSSATKPSHNRVLELLTDPPPQDEQEDEAALLLTPPPPGPVAPPPAGHDGSRGQAAIGLTCEVKGG